MDDNVYKELLSWYVDVNRDIRQKRNLTQRLQEINDLISEIEGHRGRGTILNSSQKIRDEVYYLKYQILRME